MKERLRKRMVSENEIDSFASLACCQTSILTLYWEILSLEIKHCYMILLSLLRRNINLNKEVRTLSQFRKFTEIKGLN